MLDRIPPIHPGEFIREDFMEPLGLTDEQVADAMSMPVEHLRRVLAGEAPVTAELGLRLHRCLGWDVAMWLRLQNDFDIKTAQRSIEPRELDAILVLNPELRERSLMAAE